MRTVSISRLKARLSEQLRYVKGGERVLILDRGSPVAMLAPLEPREGSGTMDELIEEGLAKAPDRPLPEGFFDLLRPADPCGEVRRALQEEREEGR